MAPVIPLHFCSQHVNAILQPDLGAPSKVEVKNPLGPFKTKHIDCLEPQGQPFINGCFNWMIYQIFI